MLLIAVAAVMLTNLLSGVAARQAANKARIKQAGAAEAIHEHLRADTAWTKRCPATCTIATHQLPPGLLANHMAASDGLALSASIAAQAVDADRNGIPDYWRVRVIVNGTSKAMPKLKPVVMTSDLHAAAGAPTGTLLVRFCLITDQIDNRLAVATCPKRSSVEMPPPEPDGPTATTWAAADDSLKVMTISPWANRRYVLHGPRGTRIAGHTDSTGAGLHPGLEPGMYRIELGEEHRHFEVWPSHSLPAAGFASVEAGQRSQVLQVFKPRARQVRMTFETWDVTVPWLHVPRPGTDRNLAFKLVGEPFGRTQIMEDLVEVEKGTVHVMLPPMDPGLYSTYVVYRDMSIGNRLETVEEQVQTILLKPHNNWSSKLQFFLARYKLQRCDPQKRLELWLKHGGTGERTYDNAVTVKVLGKEYRLPPTCRRTPQGSTTIAPPSSGGAGGA